MRAFVATEHDLTRWLRGLAAKTSVYFPQKTGSRNFRFDRVDGRAEMSFAGYRPTVVPPGRKIAPEREVLFRFRRDEKGRFTVRPTEPEGVQILAGVRPCDLRAIKLMDIALLDGPGDTPYRRRREATAIVAADCLAPCDDFAFCAAVGSLTHRDGADVFLTPLHGDFLVEALTDRGSDLVDGAPFKACANAADRKAEAEAKRAKPFGRQLVASPAALPKIIEKRWASAVWDRSVSRCFSCGTCNVVCPTCYCFDVRDDLDVRDPLSGERTRHWDACMLPQFAAVADGHNFRPTAAARQRHRVKRKFEYLPNRFGEGSYCVGCGRCARQCTAGIDIAGIVNDLAADGEVAS
ncbi:MAG: 4Fe-4S dicluster domain-containing protein [Deltaproteobacteria bacterium]|nr:4Fe-4S dicluster domain-containing protein [Deltaproteobacteria bacterium]